MHTRTVELQPQSSTNALVTGLQVVTSMTLISKWVITPCSSFPVTPGSTLLRISSPETPKVGVNQSARMSDVIRSLQYGPSVCSGSSVQEALFPHSWASKPASRFEMGAKPAATLSSLMRA
jgi:hypothetical protein